MCLRDFEGMSEQAHVIRHPSCIVTGTVCFVCCQIDTTIVRDFCPLILAFLVDDSLFPPSRIDLFVLICGYAPWFEGSDVVI